jgi:hypothetical protein
MAKVRNLPHDIKNALRGLWMISPQRAAALSRHRISRGIYQCETCPHQGPIGNGKGKKKNFEVDHIDPVVPTDADPELFTWDEYIVRLFCSPDRLQVLCRGCHGRKTSLENLARRGVNVNELR